MSCHTSASDVTACIGAATVLYFATVTPLMRLARAEHLTPRVVREAPAVARAATERTALTAAALLTLLFFTAAPEATR